MPKKKLVVSRRVFNTARLKANNALYRSVVAPSFPDSAFVPGAGNALARVMFISEAPGKDEEQGTPFAGASGELLGALLDSIGLERKDVYVTYLLKYRPPNDREPQGQEITTGTFFMEREIAVLDPEIVVTLGQWAARTFFPLPHMDDLAGQKHEKQGRIVIPLYSLRQRSARDKMFEHIKVLSEAMSEPRKVKPTALIFREGISSRQNVG